MFFTHFGDLVGYNCTSSTCCKST